MVTVPLGDTIQTIKLDSREHADVRMVRVKCYRYDGSMAADTFFSVPAHVYVRRRYVHGYVTGGDDLPDGVELAFRAHTVCEHLIKAAPSS